MLTSITCPTCEAAYRVPAESLGAGRKVRCRRCLSEWFAASDAAIEAALDAPFEASAKPAPEDPAPEDPAPEEPAPVAFEGPRPDPIFGLDEAAGVDVFDDPQPSESASAAAAQTATRGRAPRGLAMFRRAERPTAQRPARKRKPFPRPRPSAMIVAAGLAALGILVGARTPIVRAAPSLASLYETIGLAVNVRGLAIRDIRSSEEFLDGAPLLVVTGLVENVSGVDLDVPRLRLAVTAKGEREVYAWTTVAARPKLAPGETATFRARLASPPAEGQAISVRFLARRDLMAALDH